MPQPASAPLKKTPLNARHRSLGARMVEFGGWDMPVEYSGIVDEHMAVRTRAGLFDVSHMGEIEIAGADALKAVQHITSNDAARLAVNQAHYSALTTPDGTFVDDVLTYKLADEHFMLVVNASNIIKDFTWIAEHIAGIGDAVAVNTSSRYALHRAPGSGGARGAADADGRQPGGHQVLLVHHRRGRQRTRDDFAYRLHGGGWVRGVRPARRTPSESGTRFSRPGRPAGVMPAGLGARDTLRLEAAMRLYGNDMDETTTVLEADLGWIVGWKKDEFIGADVLRRQKAEGTTRKLVGFEVLDRAIARHGHDVYVDGEKAGVVTSGTQTPFLKKAIGMAYRAGGPSSDAGTEFEIDVRGRKRARAGRSDAVLQETAGEAG